MGRSVFVDAVALEDAYPPCCLRLRVIFRVVSRGCSSYETSRSPGLRRASFGDASDSWDAFIPPNFACERFFLSGFARAFFVRNFLQLEVWRFFSYADSSFSPFSRAGRWCSLLNPRMQAEH